MRSKTKYLLYREGRYYARIVIPKPLRPYLENKTELRIPLGADRRAALRQHPMAVADLMHQITLAERRAAEAQGIPQTPGRFPMTDAQLALRSYHQRLDQDTHARHSTNAYARISIDDGYAALLRMGIAGAASDAELEELIGHRIDHYRKMGNTTASPGTEAWRSLAMSLCVSEYEALERVFERDEGNFSGTPAHPLIRDAAPEVEDLPPVSLRGLFRDYIASRKLLGKGREAEKKWRPVIEHLRKHLGHDDARRITRQDVMAWRDDLLKDRSPRTVANVYLASLRTILNWAVREDLLTENVANKVRQEVPKKILKRPKGYTDDEALRILKASLAYSPAPFMDGEPREYAETTAAKKWVPLLCAFTGARVTEITQIRKQDVRQEGDTWVARITPDAGTVKTGLFRDVPLHRQIVALGFMDYVNAAPDGPLFYRGKADKIELGKARMVSGRISVWLQDLELVPEGVSPNHAWRHRFKTVAREIGASDRITDAICGHAGRTAGEEYGDVTVIAKKRLVERLPDYSL